MAGPDDAAARVDQARLWQRHMDIARHGATPAGGVNRQALSREEAEARTTLIGWGAPLGLTPHADDAGNLFLRLAGTEPDLPPVMTGSHLDSQPTGGKFDGTYGVLAGLEAVQAIIEAGVRPRRSIEIVAWMNEEGSRFAPGMMGSEAFAGLRPLDQILPIRDLDGISVQAAMADMEARMPPLPRVALERPVAAYVEAHIEQAPLLEQAAKPIGVVTGMQGKHTYRVTVTGEEAHAGTTPLAQRKDALVAASAMVQALHAACATADEQVRFTIGRLVVSPNAPSVVPGKVVFSIDLRHPEDVVLTRLSDAVAGVCESVRGPCGVTVERLVEVPPIAFPDAMRDRIREAARRLGLPSLDLLSAAGHDSRQMHAVTPTGMIFVPCRGGVSHNEAEWAEPADLAAGTRVLAAVLVELAQR